MTERHPLALIRDRIDSIDEQIHELLNQRARAAQEVARVKQSTGGDSVFYRPDREAMVMRRVMERNTGPLSDQTVALLFREIMSACLALEQPLRVAFLGPAGTFTQEATVRHFGHAVHTEPMGAIDQVFRAVETEDCHYGVAPIENSTEGVVTHTLDQFLISPLKVCGEVVLRIHHNLMGRAGSLDEVHTVHSHQQSLAQCRDWLVRRCPRVQTVAVASNALAARMAADSDDPGVAAIAGAAAADLYGLSIMAHNIEDHPENSTRFLILGRQEVEPTGNDRTSLMISAANKPGALYRLLAPFAEQGISLSRIESRPSRRESWAYVFFVDLIGHAQDEPVARALRKLSEKVAMVKVLGSYPQAVIK